MTIVLYLYNALPSARFDLDYAAAVGIVLVRG